MQINGVDISKYGAKQWTVTPEFMSISNSSEWVDGAVSPVMLDGAIGFKRIRVTVIVKGSSREKIWENSSNLVASLIKPATIKLDGFSHEFFCYLKDASQAETSLKRWHKATLELYGYEYGSQVTATTKSKTITVNNQGNLPAPAVIEITPSVGKTDMTITGLVRDPVTGADRPIIIRAIENAKTIVIDGETGLVTADGTNKFSDVTQMYDLPSLLPGNNTITVDKDDLTMTIKHKPRYM